MLWAMGYGLWSLGFQLLTFEFYLLRSALGFFISRKARKVDEAR
jgi:hypothetical protein